MKYLIIGLGNFGASLAEKLSKLGNEVIGVDVRMNKVEAMKDKITHAINLDSTDMAAVSSLPIQDADIVIVSIGEDLGANIMTTALMKQLKVKRLISRAVSPLQKTVVEAMGVEEIIHPEEETAERWSKKLNVRGVIDSFEVAGDYSIIETEVPKKFFRKNLQEINLKRDYDVIVLSTFKFSHQRNTLGTEVKTRTTQGVASASTILSEGDTMVLYGHNKNLKRLIKETNRTN